MSRALALRTAWSVAAIVALLPRPAFAHLVTTGAGPFYDGAAHAIASLDTMAPVVAVSLLAGMRGPESGRWLLALLPIAWLAGSTLALALSIPEPSTTTAVALVLVPGTLVALDYDLPKPALASLFGAFGLWCGISNGSAMALAGAGWLGAFGGAVASGIVATLVAAGAVVLARGRARIVLRVAGSWLAAFGVLALGWALKVG